MKKFIFNLDCLLSDDDIISLIAKHYDAYAEIEELNRASWEDNTPFMESLIKYVHVLGKFPIDEVKEVVSVANRHAGILQFIKNNLDACIIATEYPGCWTGKLMDSIGCACYSSDVIIENNNIKKLTYILKKENIIERYKNAGEQIVFIGNSDNDMESMRLADVSIASGINKQPANSILTVANYLTFSEDALCRQLNQLL